MKRNIDLTENQDFRKGFNIHNLKLLIDKSFYNSIYPWNFNKNMLMLSEFKGEVFFTGDKKLRHDKKNSSNYEEGLDCECCGKDLSKKRWNDYYRLCPTCNDRIYHRDEDGIENKPWAKTLK